MPHQHQGISVGKADISAGMDDPVAAIASQHYADFALSNELHKTRDGVAAGEYASNADQNSKHLEAGRLSGFTLPYPTPKMVMTTM